MSGFDLFMGSIPLAMAIYFGLDEIASAIRNRVINVNLPTITIRNE